MREVEFLGVVIRPEGERSGRLADSKRSQGYTKVFRIS